MTQFFSSVAKAEKIRCRPEEAGNYLLYNPRTDQLYLLDERGKKVFDLCDGRAIDDVVRKGCSFFEKVAQQDVSQNVLNFQN